MLWNWTARWSGWIRQLRRQRVKRKIKKKRRSAHRTMSWLPGWSPSASRSWDWREPRVVPYWQPADRGGLIPCVQNTNLSRKIWTYCWHVYGTKTAYTVQVTLLKDDEKEPADCPGRKMWVVVRSISKVSRESSKRPVYRKKTKRSNNGGIVLGYRNIINPHWII